MSMKKKFLVVGLGNIGNSYLGTRHNVGESFIKNISNYLDIKFFFEKKLDGYLARTICNSTDLFLLFPNTYMNNSGDSVFKTINFFKIGIESLLIIHDELNLDLGVIKIKKIGNHGGHNGIKSIISKIRTKQFSRLSVGIRTSEFNQIKYQEEKIRFVLSLFSIKEKKIIDALVDDTVSNITNIIKNDYSFLGG